MDRNEYFRGMVVGADARVPLIKGDYATSINFDNAATTPPLRAVMTDITNFAPWYSSIHRGKGFKSVLSSDLYEKGREVLAGFVNADPKNDHVIYTKNTTESINILAHLMLQHDKEQAVLSTGMEHLANDLPWRGKFKVEYAAVDSSGRLSMDDLENKLVKLHGQIKLVAVTGASNVTGYVNPIHAIAKLAHQHGAKILVDGAQLTPHKSIDMKPHNSPEHIDFLVFSGHKMYAPFGIGVLIGPKEFFANKEPVYKGGGTVRLVCRDFVQWHEAPAKEEAGTPNVIGVAALISAMTALRAIGIEKIHAYETYLCNYAWTGLRNVPGIRIYAHHTPHGERVSLVPFNLEGVHHNILTEILSREAGIAVRSGMFCAHPYVQGLLGLTPEELAYYRDTDNVPLPGMVRISFGMYNNVKEVDVLIDMLNRIAKNKQYYNGKYKNAILSAHP